MSEQSVTFTADELLELKIAVGYAINVKRRLVKDVGDPSGALAKEIGYLEAAYGKITQARLVALEGA